MPGEISFCPLTGTTCQYAQQEIGANSFFLIQPFDNDKAERERAIELALKKFFGVRRYQFKKSDSNVHLQASFCDICKKIRSCQFCIVDISGEIFKVLIEGEIKEKVILRPNIPFELGLAYGFNKPAIILFRRLSRDHKLPSDLDFIRYVDITSINWPMVSQKLLDLFRESSPHRAILSNVGQEGFDMDQFKMAIESTIFLKKNYERVKYSKFKINQILFINNKFILIVRSIKHSINGLCFNLYITLDHIEEIKGIIRIESVNYEKGIAQAELLDFNDHCDYWADIAKKCSQKGQYVLKEHRLEVVIPEEFKRLDTIELENLKSILDKCG